MTRAEPAGVTPASAPAYVIWEVTRACNMRCAHCAVGAGRRRQGELTTAQALDACDQLAELGAGAVSLMGGEVLLRKDWPRLARRLGRHGIPVGIFTNGLRLDAAALQQVSEVGICQVGVSLDAAGPEVHDALRGRPGAHRAATAAIRAVVGLGLRCTVVTALQRDNLGQIEGILAWLLDNAPGADWVLSCASHHEESRFSRAARLTPADMEGLARFVQEQRGRHRERLNITAAHDLGYFSRCYPDIHDTPWRGCLAGLETLGIRSDGGVSGCLLLGDEFVEANLTRRRLADLWRDPDLFAYNRRFHPGLLSGECAGCAHGETCRGGCRDYAWTVSGDLWDYPFCLHREERG